VLRQNPAPELGAFEIQVNSTTMLPQIQVKVSGDTKSEKVPMLLSLNATYTIFWADNCT